MPQTKKGKPKKSSGKNEENVDNSENDGKRRELIRRATHLKDESNRERALLHEFKQRLEKIQFFWNVEKKALEEKKTEMLQKRGRLQLIVDGHQIDLDAQKHKIKQLLSEHQDELTRTKTDSELEIKLLQEKNRSQEDELIRDRKNSHAQLKEMEIAHQEFLKNLKDDHNNALTNLRNDFRRRLSDITLYSERQLKRTREDLEKKKKMEVQKIERMNDAETKSNMQDHERELDDMRSYYNGITHKNLDLIKELKAKVVQKRKERRLQKKNLGDVTRKNNAINQPLAEGTRHLEELSERFDKFRKQKESLRDHKARLLVVEDDLKAMKWRHEVLFQRFQSMEKERDACREKFHDAIHAAQQRSHYRNMLLEKKLEELSKHDDRHVVAVADMLMDDNMMHESAHATSHPQTVISATV